MQRDVLERGIARRNGCRRYYPQSISEAIARDAAARECVARNLGVLVPEVLEGNNCRMFITDSLGELALRVDAERRARGL